MQVEERGKVVIVGIGDGLGGGGGNLDGFRQAFGLFRADGGVFNKLDGRMQAVCGRRHLRREGTGVFEAGLERRDVSQAIGLKRSLQEREMDGPRGCGGQQSQRDEPHGVTITDVSSIERKKEGKEENKVPTP